jgi:hypothetical protein
VRRLLIFVFALTGCTQDFGVFDPVTGDASGDAAANEAGSDAAKGDASADSSTSDGSVACTETGAVTFGGHCYFALGNSQSWTGASTACNAAGAHLVTITSSPEETAVAPISSGGSRWIGLSRATSDPATDASYKWITGESRAGYSDWSPGEPSGTGPCVRMRSSSQWGDDTCSNQRDAICERE